MIDGGNSGGNNQPQANPHASTYQNPNNIYKANLGEDLGKLDTGLTKNIADTQNNMTKSTGDYQAQLKGIDSGYSYNGQKDLENIGDSATFSRLSSLVNPAGEQSALNAVQSNTKNYNPDTSGLAASSSISGLSSQLKNQYGTTAGGSRLDAQLYRGSGQAGKAINENLNQLGAFKQDKQNQLAGESTMLGQFNQDATNRSNQLKSEGGAYQTQLKADSVNQAQQAQSKYDSERQNALTSLTSARDSTDYKKQIQDAINSAFGDKRIGKSDIGSNTEQISRNLQQQGFDEATANQLASNAQYTKGIQELGDSQMSVNQGSVDMTDYLKNQLLNSFSGNIDLGGIDPSKYVSEARNFNADSYIDPRYNQIGQLLGTNQIANTTGTNSQFTSDQAGMQQAIQEYMNPQLAQARSAVDALFNQQQGNNLPDQNIFTKNLVDVVKNKAFGNVVFGAASGGLNFTPGGRKVQDILQQNLGGGIAGLGSAVESGLSGIFGGSW